MVFSDAAYQHLKKVIVDDYHRIQSDMIIHSTNK